MKATSLENIKMRMKKYSNIFIVLIFLWITVCFYLQNRAVPFFADDYKWIGHWQLKHDGFWQDISQVVQTQWDFCHLENGRLFCHAMVQVLVSWGENVFDIANTFVFVFTVMAMVFMSFSTNNKKTIMPWIIVVFFLRYLIAEETTLLYWACGSMNYLLPTGMTAMVVLLLKKYENKQVAIHWHYTLLFIFSLLAGWEHEIIVLPVAFALFIYMCINYKRLNYAQWSLVFGYGLGAFLVLIAPANFSRIDGPVGMAEGNWIATLTKRLFLVFRFGYVFDLVFIYLVYEGLVKRSLVAFLKDNYFWLCALMSALLMGMVLGTSSRMRWGIDIFSFFILCDMMNKVFPSLNRYKMAKRLCLVFSVLLSIHQTILVAPFFESWKTYRDAEQQCLSSTEPAIVRTEDWHSENFWIDKYVAHPYHLLKEDAFVALPHCSLACKAELYDYLSNMNDEEYDSMSKTGVAISGEYVMPDLGIRNEDIELILAPMTIDMDYDFAFLVQHVLAQKIKPGAYPLTAIASDDIAHRIEIKGHKFICFDKPFTPVWRDITDLKILTK